MTQSNGRHDQAGNSSPHINTSGSVAEFGLLGRNCNDFRLFVAENDAIYTFATRAVVAFPCILHVTESVEEFDTTHGTWGYI